MVNISHHPATCSFVGDMGHARGWKISKEDPCMLRWHMSDVLWDIANCHIEWVCRLIAKECDLCLVRGEYDRYNGCTRAFLLKGLLQDLMSVHTEGQNIIGSHT